MPQPLHVQLVLLVLSAFASTDGSIDQLSDCTHELCPSTKYDDSAPSPLRCPGFGELEANYFETLGPWQKRYGRDNLKLSEHFLDEVYRERVEPVLQEGLQTCPAAILEVMMNSLLAVETREGLAAAKTFLLQIYRFRDMVLSTMPADDERSRQVRQLMVEWNADIAYVYPKLLDIERLGPNRTLPGGPEQQGSVDDLRSRQASDWCLGQRFFVYQLPDPSLYGPGTFHCLQGQWGTEVLLHHYFRHNCNTLDPELADWFYVPVHATCQYVKLNENFSKAEDEEVVLNMDVLSSTYIFEPLLNFLRSSVYYHRRQGRDHVFLFADGQGPRIWDSYDMLRSESVFLSPESRCPTWGEPMRRYVDIKQCLSTWKDTVIPGHTDYARIQYMKSHNKNAAERRLLMTFHGRAPDSHGAYGDCAVRGALMKLGRRFGLEEGVDIGGFVGDYLERKGDSHFCLVPAGTSPWTNHLYESFYAGCIPVILSDEYEVAFLQELPWEKFSIKWPESRVCDGPPDEDCQTSRLYTYLRGLVEKEPYRLWQMKNELEKHSCYFNWYSTDEVCSPYYLIQLRLRGLLDRRYSSKRFWNSADALHGSAPEQEHFLHLERPTRFKHFEDESSRFSWLHGPVSYD